MINIDGESLNLHDLAKVAYEKEKVSISEIGKEKIFKIKRKVIKIAGKQESNLWNKYRIWYFCQ